MRVVVIVEQSPQRSEWHEAEMFTDRVTVQTFIQTAFSSIRWLPSSHSHVSSDFLDLARFTSYRRKHDCEHCDVVSFKTIQWIFDILKYKQWITNTRDQSTVWKKMKHETAEALPGVKQVFAVTWWGNILFKKWRSSIQWSSDLQSLYGSCSVGLWRLHTFPRHPLSPWDDSGDQIVINIFLHVEQVSSLRWRYAETCPLHIFFWHLSHRCRDTASRALSCWSRCRGAWRRVLSCERKLDLCHITAHFRRSSVNSLSRWQLREGTQRKWGQGKILTRCQNRQKEK